MKKTLLIISILLICLWIAPALAHETSHKSMETLREEAKADKKALTEENLKLTYNEGKAFWPLYESYQKDLDKINERLATLITDYAKDYREKSLSDKKAKQLISKYLTIEEDQVKLKKSYMKKLSAVIPNIKVMTYLQMENKIQSIIRFDCAIGIPLAE
jgi:hypothetical protein